MLLYLVPFLLQTESASIYRTAPQRPSVLRFRAGSHRLFRPCRRSDIVSRRTTPYCAPKEKSAHPDIFSVHGPSHGAYHGSRRPRPHGHRNIPCLPPLPRSFRGLSGHSREHRSRVPQGIPQTPGTFPHVPSFRGRSGRRLSPRRLESIPYSGDSQDRCWMVYKIHGSP